jgi:hypothetical protein
MLALINPEVLPALRIAATFSRSQVENGSRHDPVAGFEHTFGDSSDLSLVLLKVIA